MAVVFVELDMNRRSAKLLPKQAAKIEIPAVVLAPEPVAVVEPIIEEPKPVVPVKTTKQKIKELVSSVFKRNEAAKKKESVVAAVKPEQNKKTSSEQLQQYSQILANKNASEDERTEAVEMLAREQSVEALEHLEQFVADSGSSKKSKKTELESILKAQAIEGIAAFSQKDVAISALNFLSPKVSEPFLKDRIKRSMATLKNQVENPEDEEADALRKLVE